MDLVAGGWLLGVLTLGQETTKIHSMDHFEETVASLLRSLQNRSKTIAAFASFAVVVKVVYSNIIHPFWVSAIRKIPGPPVRNPFLLAGNLPDLKSDVGTVYLNWVATYGPIVRNYRFLNQPAVLIASPSGVRRVLSSNADNYGKTSSIWKALARMFGPSLFVALGDNHKRQRAVCNPAFRVGSINRLIPHFIQSALETRLAWSAHFTSSPQTFIPMDITLEMSKPTLDVIGRCGFSYEFNAVSGGSVSPLNNAMNVIVGSFGFMNMLVDMLFPFAKYVVPSERRRHAKIRRAKELAYSICLEIVNRKRRELVEKKAEESPDLITLVLKASMEMDVKNTLTDEEAVANIMTFLLAGHETTSNALAYTLEHLAQNIHIQEQLRTELISSGMANPNTGPSDDFILSSQTYLEAVCKESLRMSPPVATTHRIALEDDVIDGYVIPKGTYISVSPEVMHKSTELWGADARDFKPERWLTRDGDDSGKPYGSYMPFFNGSANCIGSRFAMLEFKCILAVLVRSFQFEVVEGFRYKKVLALTNRPDPCLMLNVAPILV